MLAELKPKNKSAPEGQALKAALDKARTRLLPLLILIYILDFLDRSNLSYAKAAYQASTGLGNAAYAFGAGVFFIGYAFFSVPANLILHRIGARRWLCSITVAWGLIAASMALADTEMSFYSLRFLLGVAEAGFFPGVIFYLTQWFPQRERGQVFGLFYWGFPLSMAFGGPLSGWLMEFGGVAAANWRLLFVVEGLMASLVGLFAYRWLLDGPRRASWLNSDELNALLDALRVEELQKEKRAPSSFFRSLTDWKVLQFSGIFFAIQVSVYGVVYYLPERIAGTMHSRIGLAVGAVTAIPWIVAVIVTRAATVWGDRTGKHRPLAALMMALAAAGIAASTLSDRPVPVIIAFCAAASGFVAVQPLFWTQPSRYLTGAAAAGGIGLINCIGNFGGFVAPAIKTYGETTLHNAHAGMYLLSLIGILATLVFLAARSAGHAPE
jgi:MFS family permease